MKAKAKIKKPPKTEDLLRRNRQTFLFNDRELRAFEIYCKKYKIKNKARFIRETIITEVLRKFDEDHPTLF